MLPAALAEELALDAAEQERQESFALELVRKGESARGIFSLSEARRGEYEAWCSNQER